MYMPPWTPNGYRDRPDRTHPGRPPDRGENLSKALHQAKVGDKKSSAKCRALQAIQDCLAKGRPAAGLTFPGKVAGLPLLELLTAKPSSTWPTPARKS